MLDPSAAAPKLAKMSMSALMKLRADLTEALEAAEATWLEASEAVEGA